MNVEEKSKDVEALAGTLQKVSIEGGVEMASVEQTLSPSERKTVSALQTLQDQQAALSSEFEAAVLKLKLEYETKYKPLYEQRRELLLRGADGEVQASEGKDPSVSGTPGIPSFWLKAMKANRLLAEVIEEQDEAPLTYLQNIHCEWLFASDKNKNNSLASLPAEGSLHPESFRLIFTFAPNPYFPQTTLVKEYNLVTAPGGRGAELSKTEATEIEWAAGKDPTKKTVMRKQRNKKTKLTRTVAETVNTSSFFNLFTMHEIPSDDKLETMEVKDVQVLQEVVEADYDLGVTIRDKIIPRALDWFLGHVEDDSDYDEFDVNDDDYDDSEDSEEDSDSDSDSEDEVPRGSRGAGKGGDTESKTTQRSECKQQ